MHQQMKPTALLLTGIALCSACRSTKEQVSHLNSEFDGDSRSYQSLYTWHNVDSTGRYWQYSGDTSFYYHPDSGFYAHSGTFQLYESFLKAYDKAHLSKEQHKRYEQRQVSGTSKKTSSKSACRITFFMAMATILIFFVWRLWKWKCHKRSGGG